MRTIRIDLGFEEIVYLWGTVRTARREEQGIIRHDAEKLEFLLMLEHKLIEASKGRGLDSERTEDSLTELMRELGMGENQSSSR